MAVPQATSNMDGNSSEDFSHFIEIVKNGQIWYKCTLCPKKEFRTKNHRRYHGYWHDKNKPKPYNCATCGAGFIVKSHYNYHLGTHSSQRPYKCPTCKKGFLSRSKLNRHAKTHAGKLFPCRHCKKKFVTTAGRKHHEKTHSSENRGNNRRTLRRQANTSSGEEKPFPCTTCDKEFRYAKDLKRHALVHTGVRKFMCLICKEKHQRKDNLTRHIRKVHEQTEEAAKEFVWELDEDDDELNSSPEASSENSEEDTVVELDESSSDNRSSSTTESSDSEQATSTEDDNDDKVEVTSAEGNEHPEIFNAARNEEETAVVDAMPTIADTIWYHEPLYSESMTIVEVEDYVKTDEAAVAEVIFNKDALVITRVTKVDDEKAEMGVTLTEIGVKVVSNEGNVENTIGDFTHCEEAGITWQEDPEDTCINDDVYTSTEKVVHLDHSYAYIERSIEPEPDSYLEATVAIEPFANEGEILDDSITVDQNASPLCGEEASLHDAAADESETVTQLLFSLKEKTVTEHDLEIHNTSVKDIVDSAYLERKRIIKQFLSFLCNEDKHPTNKENEPLGNVTAVDQFGVSREMEAGGILTLAKNKYVHMEPLLIQKLILYSKTTEPVFCTIKDVIIVHEQQQNDIVELHYWDASENDHAMEIFNQELAFQEGNLINEDAIANNEDAWNSDYSLEGESAMNAIESNCMVVGLMSPQDIQNTYEYQTNLDEKTPEEFVSTENSPWNESESQGDYYGEQLHQTELEAKGEYTENHDNFEEFHVNPETDTGIAAVSHEECLANDKDKQAEGKVKLIQIPKKRQTSWYINGEN